MPKLIRHSSLSACNLAASFVLSGFLLPCHLLLLLPPATGQDSGNLTKQEVLDAQLPSEFARIATNLERSANPFLGRAQLEARERQLMASGASPSASGQIRLALVHDYLRWGQIRDAETCIAPLIQSLDAIPASRRSDVRFAAALIALRKAERLNCIDRYQPDCCIFPLRGGGIHTQAAPAREALKFLDELLRDDPNRLDAQWLLNIAAMAADSWPEEVPEPFRIPPALTAPKPGIRSWVNAATEAGVDAFDLCGGVVTADFDGNGSLDIVTSTSDPSGAMHLYLNKGDGTFRDGTASSGLDLQRGGLNVIGADYDNDGDRDLLVLRGAWLGEDGRIRNSLLRHEGTDAQGHPRFADVTARAGLADRKMPTQAAAWADFDGDGALDLFVSCESRGGAQDFPCQLFRNQGDGTFVDVAAQAGVTNDRFSKGVTVGDYDNDGDADIFVSNAGECRLYRNEGGMRFTDVAKPAGVTGGHPLNFAPWFFDYDNDGWLDLFVAGYHAKLDDMMHDARGEPHSAALSRLFRNNHDGTFTDVASHVGLDHAWLPMGANFGDVDNDGWLDIYLATGDPRFEMLVPNVLLRSEAGQRFEDITFSAGLGHLQKGHGVAFADFDDDGDQDLYNQLGGFYPDDKFRNALFLNPGTPGHGFISLELTGTKSNRDAIGARITLVLELPGGGTREIHRAAGSVSSFGGSPLRQEIGLGNATGIRSLTVRWPAGTVETFSNVPRNTAQRIKEGSGQLEQIQRRGRSRG